MELYLVPPIRLHGVCRENVTFHLCSYPGLEEMWLPARQCARKLLDGLQFPGPDLVWPTYSSQTDFTNARYCEPRLY